MEMEWQRKWKVKINRLKSRGGGTYPECDEDCWQQRSESSTYTWSK